MALCVLAGLGLASTLHAQSVWTGAAGNNLFGDAGNWSVAPVSGINTSVLFNNTDPALDGRLITLGADWTLGSISVADVGASFATFTINDSVARTLTFASTAARASIMLDKNKTLIFGPRITFALNKDLNLWNNSSAGGQIIVNGAINGNGNYIYAYSNAFTNDSIVVSGVISGVNTVLVKEGNGLLRLDGANTFTGGVDFKAGRLDLENNAALGHADGALRMNSTSGIITTLMPTLTLANGFDFQDATLTFQGKAGDSSSHTVAFNGVSRILGANTIATDNNWTASLGGMIFGDGRLVKSGQGNLILKNANNQFSGGLVVSQGILEATAAAGHGYTMGSVVTNRNYLGAGDITINSGAELLAKGAGGFSVAGGKLTVDGPGSKLTIKDTSFYQITGGTTTLSNGGLIDSGANVPGNTTIFGAGSVIRGDTVNAANSGTLRMTNGTIQFNGGSFTNGVNLDFASPGNTTISSASPGGSVTGDWNFIKSSANTITFLANLGSFGASSMLLSGGGTINFGTTDIRVPTIRFASNTTLKLNELNQFGGAGLASNIIIGPSAIATFDASGFGQTLSGLSMGAGSSVIWNNWGGGAGTWTAALADPNSRVLLTTNPGVTTLANFRFGGVSAKNEVVSIGGGLWEVRPVFGNNTSPMQSGWTGNGNWVPNPKSWNDELNWDGGVPNMAGAEAYFGAGVPSVAGGRVSVTLNNTARTIGSLTINSTAIPSSYYYSERALNIGSGTMIFNSGTAGTAARWTSAAANTVETRLWGSIKLDSDLLIDVQGAQFVVDALISGPGGIIKDGDGLFIIYNAFANPGDHVNYMTTGGGITLNRGELLLTSNGSYVTLGNGPLTINSGSLTASPAPTRPYGYSYILNRLVIGGDFFAGNIRFAYEGDVALNGAERIITNSLLKGSIHFENGLNLTDAPGTPGRLTLAGSSTTWLNSGSSSFSGGLVVDTTVATQLTSDLVTGAADTGKNFLGTGTVAINSGKTLSIYTTDTAAGVNRNATLGKLASNAGTINVYGGGATTLLASSTLNGGALYIEGDLYVDGQDSFVNDPSLTVNTNGSDTKLESSTGWITRLGTLTKNGAGTTDLRANLRAATSVTINAAAGGNAKDSVFNIADTYHLLTPNINLYGTLRTNMNYQLQGVGGLSQTSSLNLYGGIFEANGTIQDMINLGLFATSVLDLGADGARLIFTGLAGTWQPNNYVLNIVNSSGEWATSASDDPTNSLSYVLFDRPTNPFGPVSLSAVHFAGYTSATAFQKNIGGTDYWVLAPFGDMMSEWSGFGDQQVPGNFYWSSTYNWSDGLVPNSAGAKALIFNLDGNLDGKTIYVDADSRLGKLDFNSSQAQKYIITSTNGGRLIIDNTGAASGTITMRGNATGGQPVLGANIHLQDGLVIDQQNASLPLILSGTITGEAGKGITKVGAGMLDVGQRISGTKQIINSTYDGGFQWEAGNLGVFADGSVFGAGGLKVAGAGTRTLYASPYWQAHIDGPLSIFSNLFVDSIDANGGKIYFEGAGTGVLGSGLHSLVADANTDIFIRTKLTGADATSALYLACTSNGFIHLSGDNDFAGGLTLGNGSFAINHDNALGAGLVKLNPGTSPWLIAGDYYDNLTLRTISNRLDIGAITLHAAGNINFDYAGESALNGIVTVDPVGTAGAVVFGLNHKLGGTGGFRDNATTTALRFENKNNTFTGGVYAIATGGVVQIADSGVMNAGVLVSSPIGTGAIRQTNAALAAYNKDIVIYNPIVEETAGFTLYNRFINEAPESGVSPGTATRNPNGNYNNLAIVGDYGATKITYSSEVPYELKSALKGISVSNVEWNFHPSQEGQTVNIGGKSYTIRIVGSADVGSSYSCATGPGAMGTVTFATTDLGRLYLKASDNTIITTDIGKTLLTVNKVSNAFGLADVGRTITLGTFSGVVSVITAGDVGTEYYLDGEKRIIKDENIGWLMARAASGTATIAELPKVTNNSYIATGTAVFDSMFKLTGTGGIKTQGPGTLIILNSGNDYTGQTYIGMQNTAAGTVIAGDGTTDITIGKAGAGNYFGVSNTNVSLNVASARLELNARDGGTVEIAGNMWELYSGTLHAKTGVTGTTIIGERAQWIGDWAGADAATGAATAYANLGTIKTDGILVKTDATAVRLNAKLDTPHLRLDQGSLLMQQANLASGIGALTINGGTLGTGGANQTFAAGSLLDMTASGGFDVGGTGKVLFDRFNISADGKNFGDEDSLFTIYNWKGVLAGNGNSQFLFSATSSGINYATLLGTRIDNIRFDGYTTGVKLLQNGANWELVPLSVMYTWTGLAGADSSWSNANNWTTPTGPAEPNAAGAGVLFDDSSANRLNGKTIAVNFSRMIGEFEFNGTQNQTFTITGADLTMKPVDESISSDLRITMTANSNNNPTIALGALVLSGTGGGNLIVNNQGSGTVTISAPIQENAPYKHGLVKTGTGVLALTSGQSSFSGSVTLDEGTLQIGADSTAAGNVIVTGPLGKNTLTIDGGALQSINGDHTIHNKIALGTGNLVLLGTNALTLDGAKSQTIDLVQSTTITVADASGTLVIAPASIIAGANKLTKDGAGTLKLDGANVFFGGAELAEGTLALGHDDALANNTLEITADATLRLDGPRNVANAITISPAATGTFATTGAAATLAAVIDGDGSVVKTGAGELSLTAANAYAGDTRIDAGSLRITDAAGASAGAVTIDAGARLNLDFANATFDNQLAGTGTATVSGTKIRIDADNTASNFSGQWHVAQNASALVNDAGDLGAASSVNIAATGTLTADGAANFAFDNALTGAGVLNAGLADTGTFTFGTGAGNAFAGRVSQNGPGAFLWDANASTALTSATLSASAGRTLVAAGEQTARTLVANGGTLAITGTAHVTDFSITSGAISYDPAATALANPLLRQDEGESRLLIRSDNAITGDFADLALVDASGAAYNTSTYAIGTAATGYYSSTLAATATTLGLDYRLTRADIHAGQTLLLENDDTAAPAGGDNFTAQITGTGNLETRATKSITLTNASNTFTGTTLVTSGTLIGGAAGIIASSTRVDISAGATFDTGAHAQTLNHLTAAATNATTRVNAALTLNNTVDSTYAGGFVGANNITKTGAAAFTASGNSSAWTGNAAINAGVLNVTGQFGGTGALGGTTTINTGATLKGTGTTNNVVIATGGHLAPGQSPGRITIGGDLAIQDGANLDWELGAITNEPAPGHIYQSGTNDRADVLGDVTLTGTSLLNLVFTAPVAKGEYDLINYLGALTGDSTNIKINTATGISAADFAKLVIDTTEANWIKLLANLDPDQYVVWDGSNPGLWDNGAIDGGNGTWYSTGAVSGTHLAWTDGGGATNGVWLDGGFAIFKGAAGTVTVENAGDDINFSGAQFRTDGYLLTGGTLTTAALDSQVELNIDATVTTTIATHITGTHGLKKTGGGTLVLAGTVDLASGTLTAADGLLDIAATSHVSSTGGEIGSPAGSNAAMNVTGTWTNTGRLYVGEDGRGSLTLGGAANVTAADAVNIGHTSTGTGVVTITGSAVLNAASTFRVGGNGDGTMTVSDSGTVTSDQGSIGHGSGTGSVTLSDNAAWIMANTLYIGGLGSAKGTLLMEGNSYLETGASILSFAATATSGVTVTDNAYWNTLGALALGVSGTSTVAVEQSGSLASAGGVIGSGAAGSGAVTLKDNAVWTNSSTLAVGNSGTGALDIGGAATVKNTTAYIGNNASGVGRVAVDGAASWQNSETLHIGNSGTGTLDIAGSGYVENVEAFVGTGTYAKGTVNISDSGTWRSTGNLLVGYEGNAELNIADSGKVIGDEEIYIGHLEGAEANVVVANSGQIAGNKGLVVGRYGSGTLTIQDDASVTANENITIGQYSTGHGEATVKGNATLTGGASLRVGANSQGILAIQDSGTVRSASGAIGSASQSDGRVTLEDNGAWISTGHIFVAGTGTGVLTLNDYSRLESAILTIGAFDTGNGAVTVLDDSRLDITGTLAVGLSGTGALTVTRGYVSATHVRLAHADTSSAALTLNGGGVIETAGFSGGDGATTLDINGGSIVATAANDDFFANLGDITLNGVGVPDNTAALDFVTDGIDVTITNTLGYATSGGARPIALSKRGEGMLTAAGDLNFGDGMIGIGTGTLRATGTIGASSIATVGDSELRIENTNDWTYAGELVGTGSLVKTGEGSFTLTGSHAYAGDTTIDAGQLYIDGTAAAGVNANAGLLGGNGLIQGAVTLNNTSTLAPGSLGATGTLTTGALALGPDTALAYQLGDAGNDLVNATQGTGDLTLGGTLNVAANGVFGTGAYRLINYTGALTNPAGLALGILPVPSNGENYFIQTGKIGQVNLVYIDDADTGTVNYWDGARADYTTIEGGSGTWSHFASNRDNWANETSTLNAPWQSFSHAMFTATGGTVTVDNTSGDVTLNGATFTVSDYLIQGDSLFLGGTTSALFDTQTGTATIDSVLTGSAGTGITKSGTGTLVLTASNAYTGTTTITAGTLRLENLDATGAAGVAVAGNAELLLGASGTYDNNITGSGTTTIAPAAAIDITGTNTVAAWNILGSGTVAKQENLGDGATHIDGALAITTATNWTYANTLTGQGTITATLAERTGTFAFVASAGNAFAGTLDMRNGYFQLDDAGETALSAATLKLGTGGSSEITGTNRAIGGLVMDSGILRLQLDQTTLSPSGTLTVTDLDVTAGGTIAINKPAGMDTTIDPTANFFSFGTSAAQIQVVKSLNTPAGNGTLLDWTDYNGDPIGNPAIIDITENAAVTGAAIFDFLASVKNDGVWLGFGLTELWANTGTYVTLSGAVAGANTLGAELRGEGGFTFDNTGVVRVGNPNSDYTGATHIASGTVEAITNNALGDTSHLALDAGTGFDLGGNTQTIGSLDGASTSTLNVNSGSLAITSGGTSAGTLTGAGTLDVGGYFDVLGANENLSAGVNITGTAALDNVAGLGNSGTATLSGNAELLLDASGTLAKTLAGEGAVTLANTSTVALAADNTAYTGTFAISADSRLVAETTGNLGAANLTGAGTFEKQNAATTITIDHANDAYTGTTFITAGTLAITAENALGTGDIVATAPSGTSAFVAAYTGALANNISGAGTAVIAAGAAIDITGTNTVAAWNILGSGTVTKQENLGPGATNIDGTLDIDSDGAWNYANVLTGTGILKVDTNDNAFSFGPATGANFAGTAELRNGSFDLSGDNTAALTHATLQIDSGNHTTVGDGVQQIGNLTLASGTITFAIAPSGTAAQGLIRTGVLDVRDTVVRVDTAGLVNGAYPLLQQDEPRSLALVESDTLAFGSKTLITGSNLVDADGNELTDATQRDIIQGSPADVVASGTYDFAAVASNTGLHLGYELTALDLLAGKTTILDSDIENAVLQGADELHALVTGDGNLAIDAAHAITLNNAANTYTGTTFVRTGTLVSGNDNVLGQTAHLDVAAAATYDLNGHVQTVGGINTAASSLVTLGTGALTIASGGRIDGALAGATGGSLTLNSGTTHITSANTAFAAATNIAAPATAHITDAASLGSSAIALDGTLIVDTAANGTMRNSLAGSGLFQKINTGTVTLAASGPAFAGSATIAQGRVIATRDDSLGTAPVAVDSGAAYELLGVTGTLKNTVSGAGTLAFTDSAVEVAHGNTMAASVLKNAQVVMNHDTAFGPETSSVTLDRDSVIYLNVADARLGSVSMNNGTIAFTTPRGVATIANLDSTPGNFVFDVDLAAAVIGVNPAGTVAHHLTITNGADATHSITVNPVSAPPAAQDLAIELITMVNGNPAFELVGGQMEYDLTSLALRRGDGTGHIRDLNKWYLTDAGLSHLADAIINTAATLALDSLYLRMGDVRAENLGTPFGSAGGKASGNVWVRTRGYRMNAGNELTGMAFNQNAYGVTAGADKNFGGESGAMLLGGFVDMGGINREFDNNGTGETRTVGAGAYLTFLRNKGWFTDIVAKLDRYSNDFEAHARGGDIVAGRYSSKAFTLSVEAGKRFQRADGWWLEPSVQAAQLWLTGADYATQASASARAIDVQVDDSTMTQYRALARFGRQWKDSRWYPYGKIAAVTVETDGGEIKAQNQTFATDYDGRRLEFGFGTTYRINEISQVYFDYEYAKAARYERPWSLNLGYRRIW